MGFYVVFNDIHLWAVIFSVVIINYIFQDGKSDYFQGQLYGSLVSVAVSQDKGKVKLF